MVPTNSRIKWLWVIILAGCLLITPLCQPVSAASLINPAQTNLVISQFRTRGPGSASDEFIEIFNPTSVAIDVSGWKLSGSNGTGTTQIRYPFPAGIVIQPGQHYLIANTSYTGSVLLNGSYSTGITDDGGIALMQADNSIVDQVGMSSGSAYKEGTTLSQLSGSSDQSYLRKSGGYQDTDDNFNDFSLISPSLPQNAPTPTATNTATDTFTATPTATPSGTFTPTDTPTATSTSTDTATPTDTGTPTPTGSATGTFTPTSTGTATPTASYTFTPSSTFTASPVALTHIVISELRSRGPNGTDDEFIELYNPTGGTVSIGGWGLRRSSSCGTTTYSLLTIPYSVSLLPGQHYLAAATGSSLASTADQTFSPALADDGGVALVNLYGYIIDQVGMCSTTYYLEGGPLQFLPPLVGNSNQSYERKPGGDTACVDTDKNAADFALIPNANPQNKASPAVLCSGVMTYTPTLSPTPSKTPTRTSPPTAIPSTLLINEFLPHPRSDWNEDQVVNVGDEYIELINIGTTSLDLQYWKLDNDGTNQYTLPDMSLLPGQIAVFFHSQTHISLSDGGGTIRLINPSGRIVDAFTYPVVPVADQTWCRLPDGTSHWGFACRPSPGWPNLALVTGTPGPESGTPTPAPDLCSLADTVPPSIADPECAGFGGALLNSPPASPHWLDIGSKWGVFVE